MNVRETCGEVDGEDDEDNVAFRVAQRSETVVFFLASGIPQRELNQLALELDLGYIVLEHSWNIRLVTSIIKSLVGRKEDGG